jgi:hypothetical protein
MWTGIHPLRDLQGDGVGIGGILRPVHLDAIGGQVGFELGQQTGQIGKAVLAYRRAQVAQALQLIVIAELSTPFGL